MHSRSHILGNAGIGIRDALVLAFRATQFLREDTKTLFLLFIIELINICLLYTSDAADE